MNKILNLIIVVLLLTTIATAKDVREIKVLNEVYGDVNLDEVTEQNNFIREFFLIHTNGSILLTFNTVIVDYTDDIRFTTIGQTWISPKEVYIIGEYDLIYIVFNTPEVVVAGAYFDLPFETIQQPINDSIEPGEYYIGINGIIEFFIQKFNRQNIMGFDAIVNKYRYDISNKYRNKSEMMEQYASILHDWQRWDELEIGELKPLGLIDSDRNQKPDSEIHSFEISHFRLIILFAAIILLIIIISVRSSKNKKDRTICNALITAGTIDRETAEEIMTLPDEK